MVLLSCTINVQDCFMPSVVYLVCWTSLLLQPPCFLIPKAVRHKRMLLLHWSLSSSKTKCWFHISKGLIEFHPMENHTSAFSHYLIQSSHLGILEENLTEKKWDKVNLVLLGKWFQLRVPRHIPNTEYLDCSIAFKTDKSSQEALTRMSWGLRELTRTDKAEPHHQTREVHIAHSDPHTCTRYVHWMCVSICRHIFIYHFFQPPFS